MGSRTKKNGKLLTEDEFYSIILEGLRKKGLSITAGFVVVKAVSLEERRREAEKPLFLARYE